MTNEIISSAVLGTQNLYIDPSSVTIIASSISAVAIAVGATAIIIWRRAKNKLKIGSNTKKEVEDDIVINDKDNENK